MYRNERRHAFSARETRSRIPLIRLSDPPDVANQHRNLLENDLEKSHVIHFLVFLCADVSLYSTVVSREDHDLSMSPSLQYINALLLAQQNLYRFGGPIVVFIGTINALLGLVVFTQKSLRKSPCSIYFIAYNIAILFLIGGSFLPITLEIGYRIVPPSYNIILCRLRLFTTFLFNCLCPYYLLLASIDRVLVTSPNARTRQLSTHRLAYGTIIVGTIVWMIFLCHLFVFARIVYFAQNLPICYPQLGWYLKFISGISLTKEISIPLLMIIFGLWSIKHIRHVRRVTIHSTTGSNSAKTTTVSGNSMHSKDRQLVIMLLTDCSIYIIFSCILAIQLMYEQITSDRLKSYEGREIERLLKSVAMFTAHLPFCLTSYVNLIVSKTFRREVKEHLFWKRSIYHRRSQRTGANIQAISVG